MSISSNNLNQICDSCQAKTKLFRCQNFYLKNLKLESILCKISYNKFHISIYYSYPYRIPETLIIFPYNTKQYNIDCANRFLQHFIDTIKIRSIWANNKHLNVLLHFTAKAYSNLWGKQSIPSKSYLVLCQLNRKLVVPYEFRTNQSNPNKSIVILNRSQKHHNTQIIYHYS